ncbi:MAG: hypothetical protein ACREJ0_07445 [Geminicoccaceae bacterium]
MTEGRLFGTVGRPLRESLSVWGGLTTITIVDGRKARALVVRSSLVTAYLAAVGTTVWAICAELDRSPRADLTVAAAPTEAKPRVPDHEWRAWARQHVGLQKRVAALMTAQQTQLTDAAPPPAPAPRLAIAARTAWPPEPALKPVQWSGERRPLLAVDLAEEPIQPSSSAATESFWSRVLTLLEPAAASTLVASGDSDERNAPAAERAAVQQSAAPRSSGQAGASAGGDAEAEAGSSDANARSDRSTGRAGRSGSDRSSHDDHSAGSDRSVGGDRSVAGDRGRDRDGRADRGNRGDRGQRDDRGDRGDRGHRGDRGDRGDRDRGRD